MNYVVKIEISAEKTFKYYFKTLISAMSFVRRAINSKDYPENSIFYIINLVKTSKNFKEKKVLFVYKNNELSFNKGGETNDH